MASRAITERRLAKVEQTLGAASGRQWRVRLGFARNAEQKEAERARLEKGNPEGICVLVSFISPGDTWHLDG
jgi:hypothetical protein